MLRQMVRAGVAAFAKAVPLQTTRLRAASRAAARVASRRAAAALHPTHHDSIAVVAATRCRACRTLSSASSVSRDRRRRVQKKRSSSTESRGGVPLAVICARRSGASPGAGRESSMIPATTAASSAQSAALCASQRVEDICARISMAALCAALMPSAGTRYAARTASASTACNRGLPARVTSSDRPGGIGQE